MKKTAIHLLLITVVTILTTACQPVTVTTGNPTATQEIIEPTQAPTDVTGVIPTNTTAPNPALSETPAPSTGSIRGRLGYPSEVVPEMHIVAFLYETDTFYSLDTEFNQTSYQLDGLPEGNYHVVAYAKGGGSFPTGLAGGYTQAAMCGMGEACIDHTLVDVSVLAGQVVENVDLIDWLIPVPPMPLSGQPVQGAITGQLSYPSEFIPPLRIIAYRVEDGQSFSMDTQENEMTYTLPVPAGTYHVVAYEFGGPFNTESMPAGYSQAVPCGLTVECIDHSLVDVIVMQGSVTVGINPGDWYAPPGTFPTLP